jgi:multidrug transporter EmrE-like cation transporter
MSYLYLILSVIFNVVSYLVYKSISNKPHDLIWIIYFACGLILGGVNIFFFTKALKNINLSISYPIFSGACIALMIISSYILFNERMNSYNIIGAVVVIIGIILLSV